MCMKWNPFSLHVVASFCFFSFFYTRDVNKNFNITISMSLSTSKNFFQEFFSNTAYSGKLEMNACLRRSSPRALQNSPVFLQFTLRALDSFTALSNLISTASI